MPGIRHLIATKTQERSEQFLADIRDELVSLLVEIHESPRAIKIEELQQLRAFVPVLVQGGMFGSSERAQNTLAKYMEALFRTVENLTVDAREQRDQDSENILLYSCLEALVAISKIEHGNGEFDLNSFIIALTRVALIETLVDHALQWGGHRDNDSPYSVARWVKTDGTRQRALLLRIICRAIIREDCLAFVLDFDRYSNAAGMSFNNQPLAQADVVQIDEHGALEPREEEAMLNDIKEALQRADGSAKHDMARRLKLADGVAPGIRHVQLTNLLVSSLERKSAQKGPYQRLAKADSVAGMSGTEKNHSDPFDSILPQYCNYLLQTSSPQILHLLFEGTNVILRDKVRKQIALHTL